MGWYLQASMGEGCIDVAVKVAKLELTWSRGLG